MRTTYQPLVCYVCGGLPESWDSERAWCGQHAPLVVTLDLRALLRTHWITGIKCDHDTKRDKPLCACSSVDLGWHDSVGAAVDAWIDHVLGPEFIRAVLAKAEGK